jgi:diguanylate cyclase (GGDEF)-like protein/PAS domain S-box-containing protein
VSEDGSYLRALVDHSNDVLFVMDATGVLRFVSKSASWILERDPDSHVGVNALELVHPDDAQDAREALGRSNTAGHGALPIKVVRIGHGDGSWRWFEIASFNLLDDPAVRGFVVSGRDVTARVEQDAQLRASESRYRLLFETSHDPVLLTDVETLSIVDANPGAERAYGWSRSELIGMAVTNISAEPDATTAALLESGDERAISQRLHRRRDGSVFPVEVSYGSFELNGRLAVSVIRDLSERVEAAARQEQAESEFRTLVAESSDVITVLEPDGTWRSSSAAGTRLLGYPRGFDPPGGVFSLVHPDDSAAALSGFQAVVEGRRGPDEPFLARVRAADGSWRYFESVGRDLTRDSPVHGIVVNSRDVTERVEAEAALKASEERFRLLVAHASDVVTAFNADGFCIYASPSMLSVFGFEPEALLGTQARDLLHPDDAARVEQATAEQFAAAQRPAPIQHRMRHHDGSWRDVESVITNLLDEPSVRGVVGNTRDITELKAVRERLEHEATHDPLTGLPNRRLFFEVAQQALARATRSAEAAGILFLDLDGFKAINDTLGHQVGDATLKVIADRIRRCARAGDTVARIGGDEFCVLYEPVHDAEQLRNLAERVIDEISDPPITPAEHLRVGASVGAVLAANGAGDIDELVRSADTALYRAKRNGGNRVEIWDHTSA